MEYLETFKNLVDRSDPSIDINKIDLISAFEHYDIEGEPSEYLIDVYLSGLIHQNLTTGDFLEINKIEKAKDHLLLDFFFNETPLKSYLNTLEIIQTVTKMDSLITSFIDETKWKTAIEASMDRNLIINQSINVQQMRKKYSRQYNVAKSAKFFQNEGFNVELKDGKFVVPYNGLMKISDDIEAYIKLLGGKVFSKMLFDILYQNDLFDEKLGRFHLNRICGYNRVDALPPFGYLLNLAAKHTNYTVTIDSPKLINYLFSSIMEKSEYLTSIYDLQAYDFDQLTFRTIDNFTEFISEIALFDSTFSLIQLKPSNVSRILKGILNGIEPEEIELLVGANLNEIIKVINEILNMSTQLGSVTFKIDDLKSLDIEINSIRKILETLSTPGNLINKNFHLPTDKTDYIFNPLIKNGDEYILLNCSWCSPAFYEAIMTKLRSKHSKIDDRIGIDFEKYVKQEFSNNKISYSSGKYKIGRKEFECDVVIESEQTIVFIEIKKKTITRASKAGDEIKLIIDLSKSLLDAHLQTGQHELFIRDNGNIIFENGDRIDLNGRSILRIALTMLDFGGFQDNVVLDELFRNLLISDFYVNDDKYKSDFKNIQDKMKKLRDQYEKLSQYDGFYKAAPFHNCWFLSLPQLLMLLDDSKDNNSFVQNLKSIRSITSGSLDYYYDYTHFNTMFQIKSY